MDLYQTIKHLHPELEAEKDFILKDDGNGPYILEWLNQDVQQPIESELNAAWELVEFDNAVSDKKAELNKACNQSILGKFQVTIGTNIYYFSNDSEAQSNFKDTKLLFDDGTIDALLGGVVTWTAYDEAGNIHRIPLNKDDFKMVFIARVKHQNDNVSKLRDVLEPKIDSLNTILNTIDEVNSITW